MSEKIRGTHIWRPRENRARRAQIGPIYRSRAPDDSAPIWPFYDFFGLDTLSSSDTYVSHMQHMIC